MIGPCAASRRQARDDDANGSATAAEAGQRAYGQCGTL